LLSINFQRTIAMKRLALAALAALFLFPAAVHAQVQPFDICADPGASPAGYSIEQRELIQNGVTRWYCLVLPPNFSPSDPPYPMVIALHGGNGNPQNLMANGKRIIETGLTRGYVLVFAAGIVDPNVCDPTMPCKHNFWSDDSSTAFLNSIITEGAQFNLDTNRIYLLGFSGGAQQIYESIAADSFPHPIAAIATAAGSMGALKVDDPARGFPVVNVTTGTPTDALLFQGGNDVKLALDGGLTDGDSEVQLSFQIKIDLFRALNGSVTDPGLGVLGWGQQTLYSQGSHDVLAVTEPGTGHLWPRHLTAVAFDFFDSH
jgi:poly(3-hydroxybutyrate) depolymerase